MSFNLFQLHLNFTLLNFFNLTVPRFLRVIREPQDILEAPLDNEGTKKDFCSQTCLSSFNYKKQVSTKIPMALISSHSQCSMCSRYCIVRDQGTVSLI